MVTQWHDRSLTPPTPRSMWLSCVVLTASGADLINVWCEPGSFLTSTAEVLWLERLERTTPSGWKGGCWISSRTIEPAARQAEGGNKAPYCPPPLPFEDGTNWLYKRHQRKVPLRVSVTIDSLGGRPENRKVTSVITAGVHALIRPNGVVLITRKNLRWQLLLFTQGSCASWVYQLLSILSKNHHCTESTSNHRVNMFYLLNQSSCPWPSALADLQNQCQLNNLKFLFHFSHANAHRALHSLVRENASWKRNRK